MQKRYLYLGITIIYLFLYGCAVKSGPVCNKNGKIYGITGGIFQSSWDDYYERALSYMEGQCYEAALLDLNQAIKQNSRDQRIARTYGMHFIDYFPHREKALIHFLNKDYKIAEKEFELSLKQEKSDKALFYLDQVRKQLIKQKGRPASTPSITLFSPLGIKTEKEIWTSADPVNISGTARDQHYVSKIKIADKSLFIKASAPYVEFSENLKLTQGRHEIDIIAENLMNNRGKQKIIINVDRFGPVIVVKKLIPGLKIQGYVHDKAGVVSISTGRQLKTFQRIEKAFFSFSLNSGKDKIKLEAKDRLGNTTKAEIDIKTALFSGPPMLFAEKIPAITADTQKLYQKNSETIIVNIKGWTEKNVSFHQRVHIEGNIQGVNNIKHVSINNRLVNVQSGLMIFFNHSVLLKPGSNKIKIRAEDEAGNNIIKTISITHKVQSIYHLKHRYSLVMHQFNRTEDADIPNLFQSLFIKDFISRNRFQVIFQDKLKKSLNKNINASLSGVVYETVNGIEAAAWLFDNATSEILAVKDVYSQSKDNSALTYMANRLSEKFIREFPLTSGIITDHGKKRVTTVMNRKINMGWPVILYRMDKPAHDFSLPANSGYNTRIIGYAYIDEIMKNAYGARLSGKYKIDVQTGDRVISK